MSTQYKILVISLSLIIFCFITMFPGFFPFRIFESVFVGTCHRVLSGEIEKTTKTNFQGLGGVPIRNDYILCGCDRASDANSICYISQMPNTIFNDGNPLGEPLTDQCKLCQYGSEEIKMNGKIVGKACRPYRKIWKWIYKTPF